MSLSPAFFAHAAEHASRLALQVLAQDSLHLSPTLIRPAIARRLRAGLRALQAYLRRFLILLALSLEPALRPACCARPRRMRQPSKRTPAVGLRMFTGETAFPDTWSNGDGFGGDRSRQSDQPILAAPLLARLFELCRLIEDPQARARRLAFHLARRRPGPLLAPDLATSRMPARFGTEISALYAGFASAIARLSQARPPPHGPLPILPPRIRAV